jgi:hypothetical protein
MATLFEPIRPVPPITTIFIAGASDRKPRKKNSQTARRPGRGFPRALRRTAYATAIITFASHEANAPILTPHIPAMIAAATMALIATQTPQRRSGLR